MTQPWFQGGSLPRWAAPHLPHGAPGGGVPAGAGAGGGSFCPWAVHTGGHSLWPRPELAGGGLCSGCPLQSPRSALPGLAHEPGIRKRRPTLKAARRISAQITFRLLLPRSLSFPAERLVDIVNISTAFFFF